MGVGQYKKHTTMTHNFPAGFTVGSACSIITRDSYVIALRSVLLTSHPPTEGCYRGEVLCAGFVIQDTKNNMSLVKRIISSILKLHLSH